MTSRFVPTILALVATVTACGSQTPSGQAGGVALATPAPESTTSGTTAPGSVESTPSGASAPIDVTGKDPCVAIPVDLLSAFGSSPAKIASKQLSSTKLGCGFRDVNGIYGFTLFFDSGESFSEYEASSPGNVVIPSEVAGRDAYVVQDEQLGGCTVAVDTAPTQSVIANRTGPQGEPVGPLCDKAAQFAAAAIDAVASR